VGVQLFFSTIQLVLAGNDSEGLRANGDVIDVQHDVRPPLQAAVERDSSAMAKWFCSGWSQSIRWTCACNSPATVDTGTP
jgi:hypothetical protein